MAVGKLRKAQENSWKQNNKERLKNNILIKIEFWDVEVL